jgi:hypothetical protein
MKLLTSLLVRCGNTSSVEGLAFFPISSSIGKKMKRKAKKRGQDSRFFFLAPFVSQGGELGGNRNGFVNLWGGKI